MRATFHCLIMSIRGVVFEEMVESVYLSGTDGEYELLPYHFPLMGALPAGEIKIANFSSVPIEDGIVMFRNNECRMIVETHFKFLKKTWSEFNKQVEEKTAKKDAKPKK